MNISMKSAQKNAAAGKKGGIIKLLLIIVAVILVLSYFGINLREVVNAPTTQDNISYVATTSVSVWHKYLKAPVTYVWNQVFVNLIWNPTLETLKKNPPSTAPTSMPSALPPAAQVN